jgi:hypothetical protein
MNFSLLLFKMLKIHKQITPLILYQVLGC